MSDLTVVLTSCRRHDLLVKTLDSFFASNDYPLHEFIVIEDSDQFAVQNIAERYPDQPLRFVVNGTNIGQHRSIDKAYALVTTPYILHLEDDWEFPKPGVVAKAVEVIKSNPDLLMVSLRSDADIPSKIRKLAIVAQPAPFRRVGPLVHHVWFSFTFNPTVKRLSDYKKLPDGYTGFASEAALSLYYKDQGAVLGWLVGTGVDHLGWERSNYTPVEALKAATLLKKLNRFFSLRTLRKWQNSITRRIAHLQRKRRSVSESSQSHSVDSAADS